MLKKQYVQKIARWCVLSLLLTVILSNITVVYPVIAQGADLPDISNRGSDITSLRLSNNIASMTEKRVIHASFPLMAGINLQSLNWTYGGKPLSKWKQYKNRSYSGEPFIRVSNMKISKGQVNADITFDLPYGTDDLVSAGLFQNPVYKDLIGVYDLAVESKRKTLAKASIRLVPYDSYHTYNELKPDINQVAEQAARGNHRYVKTTSIGKSVQGRDIYMTILARDKKVIDRYEQVIHPAMMNHPEQLQQQIQAGTLKDYQVPIWLNNIHPNELPGVDAIFNYFQSMALDKEITYKTKSNNGKSGIVSINIDQALNHAFFIFLYTENPDGRVNISRGNGADFDLNRDNSYQTQPETRAVTEQISKWSPISFLDFHGFDKNFLIEPATPPHDPNIEYDLLIPDMLQQAKAMGETGIANTKYDYYHIPYVEHLKTVKNPKYVSKGVSSGWEDATPAFTAVYAMHHGAMGHTLEIPEMNEDSTNALYYSAAAATHYVITQKSKLFSNQLEIYKRGINNIDDRTVDSYLVNGKDQQIGRPRQGNNNFFPEYYMLPVDHHLQKNPLETYRMIQYLLRNGVKIERSTEAVTDKKVTYPEGTFVIDMHQAERGYANTVLYDGIDASDFEMVTSPLVQNFPAMRGFDSYSTRQSGIFLNKTVPVNSVTMPHTEMPEYTATILIRNSNNDAIKAVNKLLSEGKSVTMVTRSGSGYEAGDFMTTYDDLQPLAQSYNLDVKALGSVKPEGKLLRIPTVSALGEAAYVLKNLGFKVTDKQKFADVLVNTFESDALVNNGKPYIAFGHMGMENVKEWMPNFRFSSPENWDSYEGLFLADLNQENPITAPYEDEDVLYTVSGSYITQVPSTATVLASFGKHDDFFKAGWWPGHQAAKGKVLAFNYVGNNQNITVFANDLTNLDHPQKQFCLLANAIFNATSN